MYCYDCGKEVGNESRFCKYCGISLIDNSGNAANNIKEETDKSEAMDDVLKIVDKANSYYRNDNFLQAELLFRRAIELDKKIAINFTKPKSDLWMMLGLSLIKQLKLNEAEEAFMVAYKHGCDIDIYEEQMDLINKIKNDLKKQGITVDENDPKWQKYKSYYFLPPNKKAFIASVTKRVERELIEGSSKDFIVTGLITNKVFSSIERATEFVETVIESLKFQGKSIYCKHCGIELPVTAIYCKKCGKKQD